MTCIWMHVYLCVCIYMCGFLLVFYVIDSGWMILVYMVCFPIFLFLACFKILHNYYYKPLLIMAKWLSFLSRSCWSWEAKEQDNSTLQDNSVCALLSFYAYVVPQRYTQYNIIFNTFALGIYFTILHQWNIAWDKDILLHTQISWRPS